MAQKAITFEDKAIELVTKHARTAGAVFILCVLAGAAYIGNGMYRSSQESKSQEALFNIQKTVEEKELKLTKENEPPAEDKATEKSKEKSKDKKTAKKDAKDDKPKFEKTPALLAANFADDLKRYDSFISANHGKKASYMAAIQAARLAKDYKDLGQAEKILAGVVNVPSGTDIFSGLLRAQYAAVLMDEDKCPEAVKELNRIVDNKAQSYFHAHSWLRLGACYMKTKEWDKALSAFGKVEADFGNTQAATEARDLKRLALLRRQQQ